MHHHMMMTGGSPSLETQQTPMPATAHEDMENAQGKHGQQHHMTMSMHKIEREHKWFALIGAFVIIFKMIHDSSVPGVVRLYQSCGQFALLYWECCSSSTPSRARLVTERI